MIANPRADHSKDITGKENAFLAAICDEDHEGVTIKEAKMLDTSAVIADELLVTTGQPLKPEEEYTFSLAVPLATPGLKILPRKSYEAMATSQFDNPLSSRLDENDAVIYFDEVSVLWERVFVYRDSTVSRAQIHEAPTHLLQNYQALVRLMVKWRFLVGLARKIGEAHGLLTIADVNERLGQMSANTAIIEGMVKGRKLMGSLTGPILCRTDSYTMLLRYLPNRSILR